MVLQAVKWIGLAILLLLVGVWVFSPYRPATGFPYRLVKHTVEINAPADSVFHFLGNSANATKWSVFVHHITTLNAAEVADGTVGSRRRCYCNADEKGRQWDEVITQVVPGRKRQISCYNLVGFPISSEGLGTEQLYHQTDSSKCELTFTVFYLNKQPSLWDELKTSFAAYKIKSVFRQNMDNIKRIIETGK